MHTPFGFLYFFSWFISQYHLIRKWKTYFSYSNNNPLQRMVTDTHSFLFLFPTKGNSNATNCLPNVWESREMSETKFFWIHLQTIKGRKIKQKTKERKMIKKRKKKCKNRNKKTFFFNVVMQMKWVCDRLENDIIF